MKMGKIGENLTVNFSFVVVFTLCFLSCVLSVFVFGSVDLDQSKNPKAHLNLCSECSSACEKLEGHENRIKELEKQIKSLNNFINHLGNEETCPDENIWLSDIHKVLKNRGRKTTTTTTERPKDNKKTTDPVSSTLKSSSTEKIPNLEMVCDFETDGGGWTVIQKRTSGPKEEFNRSWTEYANGFGSLDKNFWMGLENIHALTQKGDQELRIQLDFNEEKRWVKYSFFSVSAASDFYRLSIGGYSGDAGDSMNYPLPELVHNGMQFSTPDKDNDNYSGNCAVEQNSGGWWFNSCRAANLNGIYFDKENTGRPHFRGINWLSWTGGYSLAKTEMKIRKRK